MPQYAALSGRRLAQASDQELYDFALRYAQGHAMPLSGVAGAGTATGAPRFARPARLELGRQSTDAALARRKVLAASLARRTTEASRQRALARLVAGYGLTTV